MTFIYAGGGPAGVKAVTCSYAALRSPTFLLYGSGGFFSYRFLPPWLFKRWFSPRPALQKSRSIRRFGPVGINSGASGDVP